MKALPTLACSLALLAFGLARLAAVTPALVWDEEFNGAAGTGPDATKWTYDLGVGAPAGWGNDELETYTDSRGNSLIVADPKAGDGLALALRAQAANGSYTSVRIKTQSTFSFTYGRMEARARMPAGIGCWPAFWALGASVGSAGWPACGEIDVMEWVGQTPTHIKGSLHATGYSGANSLNADAVLPAGTYSDAYHVFAVDWYPDQIVFSMDGVVYETRKKADIPAGTAWPFDAPFFIILNFAVGGDWPGPPNASTTFPQDYRVDYVRVYALPSTPPPSLVWAPSPPQAVTALALSAAQVSVAWKAPQSDFGAVVTGYTLQRATDAGFSQNLTSTALGVVTSHVDPNVQAGVTYYYRVTATSGNGTSDASPAAVVAASAGGGNSKLVNIATRGFVGTGSNNLIGGFVINGPDPKMVLIRASGPALATFGVAGTLPDPELQLFSGGNVLESNTGWKGNPQITAAAALASAFAWNDPTSTDSAILVSLQPGPYTAQVSGAGGDTGVSLLEVYDIP